MVALPLPELPDEIAILQTLALDLRWTWSHEGDALWSRVDEELWERTQNPWVVLQSTPSERLRALANDRDFLKELSSFDAARNDYLETPGWFRTTESASKLGGVAYFSMEFGLGAALPLYAGGLGVLAGDFLKAASDLDAPIIGVGLLYQEGYFRQLVDANGLQQEFYPYNEPAAMPVEPVILPDGGWLRIGLELPGRTVQLRVWRATVGRTKL
jgi:starch phosphorylase